MAGRVIDLKNTTITFKDGSGSPNSVAVVVGDGNLTWSQKKNMEYRLDRGNLNTVKEGDQVPVELSLTFEWRELKSIAGSTVPTPYEALTQTGAAASWLSSDTADPCAPYAIDIEVEHDPNCASGSDSKLETLLFSDFRFENIDGDYSSAQVSVSGKCNITAPTITRTNQT